MTKTESILAEATILASEHPSKDVRYFAESVKELCAENAELRSLIKDVAIPALVRSDELTYSETFSERLNKDIATLQEAVK